MDNIRKAFKLTPTDKDKRIEELEKEISVLLSCKNCPENKGGFICVKEYENKCLAQKIQYIKELQEEIKNLKKTYRKQRNKRIDELQKENAELEKKNKELENRLCNVANNLLDSWCRNEEDYCPHLAKLEKENKVLAQNLEDTEILNKTYEKKFKDLEKENTELKLKLEALEGQTPWKDIKDKSELIGKLTKAKEHIKRLLDCLQQDTNDPQTNYYVCQYMDKAEQFLSSDKSKETEERKYHCKTCRDLMCPHSGKERYEINCSGVEED